MVVNSYNFYYNYFFFQDTTTTSGKCFLAVDNNAISTESCTYYNNNNIKKRQIESISTNDWLLLVIKIFGGVNISISFLYIDVYMYVRQILSNRVTNTWHMSSCPERIQVIYVNVVLSSEPASTFWISWFWYVKFFLIVN